MKKQHIVLAAVVMIALAAFTALAATARKRPMFQVYGPEVVITTAADGVVAAARNDVHELLANWIRSSDGQRSDPSFRESSRNWWTDGASAEKSYMGRSKSEFNDVDGKPIVIEVIEGNDFPAVVFFSHQGARDPTALVNAFIASLQRQGVKPND